jgi:similar to stage IV sporulation protein
MGEVIGEYKQTITLQQPLEESLTVKSDSSHTYTDFELFNWSIPLYVGAKDTSNAYVTTNTEYFTLFGNSIPMGLTTTTAQAYTTTTKTYSEDQAKNILEERRATYEQNFLKGVEILNVEEVFATTDSSVSLTLEYTLQGNICETRDLFLR